MPLASLIAFTAVASQQVDKPTLTVYQGNFVLRESDRTARTPIEPVPRKGPLALAFRKNETWVVWDDRGLSIRVGNKIRSMRMEEQATSPRIQTRSEILSALEDFKSKRRNKGANAISGAKRIGRYVYFVLRWDDSKRNPWLETLTRVDLEAKTPKPEFLLKLPGPSMGRLAIDDMLSIRGGKLAIAVQRKDFWGYSKFNPETNKPEFERMGTELLEAWPSGITVATSSYGPTQVSASNGQVFGEAYSPMSLLDDRAPLTAFTRVGANTVLRFLSSGAVLEMPGAWQASRLADRVVVWSPPKDPIKAFAYDGATGDEVAIWRKGP